MFEFEGPDGRLIAVRTTSVLAVHEAETGSLVECSGGMRYPSRETFEELRDRLDGAIVARKVRGERGRFAALV